MAKKTQLIPSATPGKRYASFAGKPTGTHNHPVGKLTQLSLGAYPQKRYSSFAGKPSGGGGGGRPKSMLPLLGVG